MILQRNERLIKILSPAASIAPEVAAQIPEPVPQVTSRDGATGVDEVG
jgi:hypothetical protein